MKKDQKFDFKKLMTVDGWKNILTGFGIKNRDKSTASRVHSVQLLQNEVEELYSGDDIARKIVDRIPMDGTRKWIEFCNVDKEVESSLNEYIKKLDLITKCQKAWSFARLYGGSAWLPSFSEIKNGGDIQNLENPINENGLIDINSITILNRYEIFPNVGIISDLNSRFFGLPESYVLSTQTGISVNFFNMNSSRIIRFEGSILPTQKFIKNQYWHDSVLSPIYQIISNYNQSYQSISNVILDFRVAVLKLQNLSEMVGSTEGGNEKIMNRMELIKQQKSVLSMLIIGEGEEFQQTTHSLSGLKDVIDKIDQRLVAASDGIPHTILLGESPSGLGATGQSEIRDYYDRVSQEQERVLRRPLEEIFRLIFLCKNGPTGGKIPKDFGFIFCPLWQMTEAERAKMELDVANKDKIYIENAVLTPQEVASSRYGGREFSQDTKIGDRSQPIETDPENGETY